MSEYHKIDSVFKRDPSTGNKRFIIGDYTRPEFRYLADSYWVGTEKVDGTNIRISYGRNGIKGRTDNAQIPTFILPILSDIQECLEKNVQDEILPVDTILYGEGYGKKIQNGGHYISDGNDFVLFDVKINGNYQPRESVEDIADKLGIKVAPIIGKDFTLIDWIDIISNGHYRDSHLHPGARNEGVVLRPEVDLYTRLGNRIITKLKFKDFGI